MDKATYPAGTTVRIIKPGASLNGAIATINVTARASSAVVSVIVDGGNGRLNAPYSMQSFEWDDLELVALPGGALPTKNLKTERNHVK